MKAARFRVAGIVQGVYFRAFTRDLALELELEGYVRNLDDGSVEVFAQGEEGRLEMLASRLKEGPPMSRVTNVERTEEEAIPADGFQIRY